MKTFSIDFHPTNPYLFACTNRTRYFHIIDISKYFNRKNINDSKYNQAIYKLPNKKFINRIKWSSDGNRVFVATSKGLYVYSSHFIPSLFSICYRKLVLDGHEYSIPQTIIKKVKNIDLEFSDR